MTQHELIAQAAQCVALLTTTGTVSDVCRVAPSVWQTGQEMTAEPDPQLQARGYALQLGAILAVPDALLAAVRALEAELRATVNGGAR